MAVRGKTLAGLIGGAAFLLGMPAWWILTPAPAVQDGPQVVEISPNMGVLDVAQRLHDAELIRSPMAFAALAAVRGRARHLKAGEYRIPRDASMLTILSLLESGRVVQHPVLLPEGATVLELGRILQAERLADAAEVTRFAHDRDFLNRLDVKAPSLEGYVFPDTYHFVRGMPTEEILARMVQRLHARITGDILARARARGLGLHELLTLASIIEREAAVREEMPMISAVFWNRLKRDMPLQADPTVQYAVGKERRALTRADLLVDDPFNTYRRPGLPPGPIASPGLAAVDAALNPAPLAYLYFVATDDRRHVFSTTLEEHNAAVARYRLARAR